MSKCEKCGSEKVMHYVKFCPKCDKPEPKTVKIYDLFKCMYYVQANGHPDFKNKLLRAIEEQRTVNNGIVIQIYRPEEGDVEMDPTYAAINTLFDTIGIEDDNAWFEISW